jgi:hypothetical protein
MPVIEEKRAPKNQYHVELDGLTWIYDILPAILVNPQAHECIKQILIE